MTAATGFIINGKAVYPEAFRRAGITVRNWRDDPKLRLDLDGVGKDDGRRRRTTWIRGITNHTTSGKHPQPIIEAPSAPGNHGENIVRYWTRTDGQAGAQLIADTGREILCLADLALEVAYHAGSVNEVTIGIELCQQPDGSMFRDVLETGVLLNDFLTGWFEIQRQCPARYTGPIPRLQAGGADVVGVYGHRDQTDNRGRGDPGDEFMRMLLSAGYEGTDFVTADLAMWQARQRALGIAGRDADGVPGPEFVRAMRATYGRPLWVQRPIDAEIEALKRVA